MELLSLKMMLSNASQIMTALHGNRHKLPSTVWVGLGKSYLYTNKKIQRLYDDASIYKSYRTNGTLGYYIDKSAAKKLIELNSPVIFTSDTVIGYRNQLELCCINQVVVVEKQGVGSTIGSEFRNKINKPLYKRIVRRLRDKVGFIFDDYFRMVILKQKKSCMPMS